MSAAGVLELLARGAAPCMSWLDGGPSGPSFLGVAPEAELRGDSMDLLDDVERDGYWIGWLTYDLGARAILGRPLSSPPAISGLCVRRYPAIVAFEDGAARGYGDPSHVRHVLAQVAAAGADRAAAGAGMAGAVAAANPPWPLGPLSSPVPPAAYRAMVDEAREYIAAGDTYQVNLSQPFDAAWRPGLARGSVSAAVSDLYGQLRARSPAGWGGVIADGDRFIVSNSPETLLLWEGDRLVSSPIKGTHPREAASADSRERDALVRSEKDRAEHVMIVDLVRNDLGRIARPGSVYASAPQLMTLATVHHLVTHVRARPQPGLTLRRALEAVFPAGSITGAPKRRTVEIIDALEGRPRGIYCGALLVVTPDAVRVSVAIRSGLADASGIRVFGGGGITIGSDPELERRETVAKIRAFAPP